MNQPKDLEGRSALVTGSATGLGRSIALRLAERGASGASCAVRTDSAASGAEFRRAPCAGAA
jgi:NAD(P)-dependent dehydrogenase (short-subunit alcohol dehydrogenase family)